MSSKATFHGSSSLIVITSGTTSIDVKLDIYSGWKEWLVVSGNTNFLEAVRTVGGDPTVGSSFLGATFFLTNGWRIRSWEGTHELQVNGNLFVDGGGSPFVPTTGSYQVLITVQRSNLVDYLVLSGGSGGSGSFETSDRTMLTNINTIVSNLPNSGTLSAINSNINSIHSATFLKRGTVIAAGINEISSDISSPNNYFNNMFAVIVSGSFSVSRKIIQQTAGVFTFDVDLPFTAVSGNQLILVPGYNPTNGSIG